MSFWFLRCPTSAIPYGENTAERPKPCGAIYAQRNDVSNNMVDRENFEISTCGLKGHCSASELPVRLMFSFKRSIPEGFPQ